MGRSRWARWLLLVASLGGNVWLLVVLLGGLPGRDARPTAGGSGGGSRQGGAGPASDVTLREIEALITSGGGRGAVFTDDAWTPFPIASLGYQP